VRATQPLLKPLRRVIPSLFGLDMSSLVLAVLIQALLMAFVLMVTYGTFGDVLHLLMWAIIGITSLFLKIFWVAMIISVIVSWVAPNSHNPAPSWPTRSASRCWRRSAAWCRTWAAWTSRRSSPSSRSR
jgi:YggT family protein